MVVADYLLPNQLLVLSFDATLAVPFIINQYEVDNEKFAGRLVALVATVFEYVSSE